MYSIILVYPFNNPYTHDMFRFSSTVPSTFSERLTWIPFVFLESKVQTCIPFSITYNMCKQWTNCLTYNPCPEDCGEVNILKDIITGPFNIAEQNSALKISIGYVLVNDRLRGRGIPPLVLSLKKGIKTSNFQSNELHPIPSLCDYSFHKNLTCPRHNLQSSPISSGGLSSH